MKNSKTILGLLAGGMLAVTCSLAAKPADAAVLAQYTFTGNSMASSDTDPNTNASNFMVGPGLRDGDHYSSLRGDNRPSYALTFADITSTSRATALAQNTYYNFTLTPVASRVSLTSLSFGTNVGPSSNRNATGSYFAQFSSDGVNFTDIGQTYTQQTTPQNGDVPFVTRNIDLSGINSGFFTAPITFRIYQYKNGSNETSGGLRVDNVIVQGDVSPVPELSTGLLFGMAMMGMGFVAMRRKNGGAALGKSPFAL